MKLYLSSYHFGSCAQQFAQMFGQNKKVALISNALDFSTDEKRLQASARRELRNLQQLGLEPEELDLRLYFGQPEALREKLQEFGGIWMRGGNSFILRRALAQSGLDAILRSLISSDFVCGGYSAGACVLAPTLRGIDLVDEPEVVPKGYFPEIIWEGLGLVPYSIAPHYQSDHPEARLIEQSIAYFREHNMPFLPLRDGEDQIEEVKSI